MFTKQREWDRRPLSLPSSFHIEQPEIKTAIALFFDTLNWKLDVKLLFNELGARIGSIFSIE